MLKANPTWVEVSKSAIKQSIESYQSLLAPSIAIGIVLKSNAYGHGLVQVAHICQELESVNWLCTVSIEEACALRNAGITKPLLALSILDGNLHDAIKQNISLVVYDVEVLKAIVDQAKFTGIPARIHCKIDTGLSRLGVPICSVNAFLETLIKYRSYVLVEGIFTHLADSEQQDTTFAQYQLEQLRSVVHIFKSYGIAPIIIHAACSAAWGALNLEGSTLARLGIGAYGLAPSEIAYERVAHQSSQFNPRSALSWYTTIVQVKEVPSGSFIGYDRTYQTPHNARLAILPVGYWDGFDRRFSNNGFVSVNGFLAPVRGRVAMNMTIVEITHIPDVQQGHIAMLLGDQDQVRADDLARRCQTINYEIVTRINPLLPRYIVE